VVANNATSIGQFAEGLAKLAEKLIKILDLGAKLENSQIGKLLGFGTMVLNPLQSGFKVIEIVEAGLNAQGKASGATAVVPRAAAPAGASKAASSWGKTSSAPMLQTGSPYRGGLSQFAGGSTLSPSASGTFAGMQPGNLSASNLFSNDNISQGLTGKTSGLHLGIPAYRKMMSQQSLEPDLKRLDYLLAQTREEMENTAQKAEVANVQIARSFGEMAQDSINALDRLASAVQGGGALNIISAILGVGLQLGGMGVFGKSVQTNINAPRIPAYAGGTSFHPGGLALVGERGPEIVEMPRGSSVYPNGTGPGGMSVQVLPSKYFDVHVMQGVASAAPAIVEGGAQTAIGRIGKSNARQIGFR